MSPLKFYFNLVKKFPIMMQCGQSGLLMGIGDASTQIVVEKKNWSNLDYSRTLRFTTLGLFLVGPACTAWYFILNKYVGSEGKSVAMKKMVLDQVCFAPTMLFTFLMVLSFIEGRNLNDAFEKFKSNDIQVLKTNYKVWPFVQMINFYLMPLPYQIVLTQSVGVFWNMYISWITQNAKQPERPN